MTKRVRFDLQHNQIHCIPRIGTRPYPPCPRRHGQWTSLEGVYLDDAAVICLIEPNGWMKWRPTGRPATFAFFRPTSYQRQDTLFTLLDFQQQQTSFSITCPATQQFLTAYLPRKVWSVPPTPTTNNVPQYVYDIVSWDAPTLRLRKVQAWVRGGPMGSKK